MNIGSNPLDIPAKSPPRDYSPYLGQDFDTNSGEYDCFYSNFNILGLFTYLFIDTSSTLLHLHIVVTGGGGVEKDRV